MKDAKRQLHHRMHLLMDLPDHNPSLWQQLRRRMALSLSTRTKHADSLVTEAVSLRALYQVLYPSTEFTVAVRSAVQEEVTRIFLPHFLWFILLELLLNIFQPLNDARSRYTRIPWRASILTSKPSIVRCCEYRADSMRRLGNLFPAFAWALFIYSSMMGRLWLSWTIPDFFSYKYNMIPTKDNDAIQNTSAIHDSTTVETRRGTSRAKSLTTSISKKLGRQTWVSLFRPTPTNQPHFEQHWLSNFPKQIPRIFGFQLLCISASSSLWNSQ